MKKIIIFGATGSIGSSLLDIIKKDKKNFNIELMSANKNYKKLINHAKNFNVKHLIITDKKSFLKAKKIINNKNIKIYNNFNNIHKILKHKVDYTMSSISGLEGLIPTMKIIKFTKNIGIANKESIICAWNLIKKELIKYNTKFIPIDSEHFSIWSIIGNTPYDNVDKIFITASGGPFLKLPLNKFNQITVKDALKHPNWSMGKKISIDSATMMNKVFEIIEAKNIFNLDYKNLSILIHSKSYVHAIVKFNNGLTKILIHDTNMKVPIFNSLYDNQNKFLKSNNLDIDALNNLSLKSPDKNKFPVIKILEFLPKYNSLFETILITVNDFLVHKFLNNEIKFENISKYLIKLISDKNYSKYKKKEPKNMNEVIELSQLVSLKLNSKSI
jgi:1-deoxy-D-xylulose-5-phosphate reductoisomerase